MAGKNRFPRVAVSCVVVVGLAVVGYLPAIGAGFLADDYEVVAPLAGLGPATPDSQIFFRPVTLTSLVLDHALWGLNPRGFHLTNLLLHLFSCVLLAAVALELGRRWRPGAATRLAFGCGLIFALLPSHSEPVAWISGRADLLATALCLGSLWSWLWHRRSDRGVALGLSLLLFALALASKESVVTFPLIVLLGELCLGRSKRPRPEVWRPLVFAVMALAWWMIRWSALGTPVGGYGAAHLHLEVVRLGANMAVFTARALMPPLPDGWLTVSAIAIAAAAVVMLVRRSELRTAVEGRVLVFAGSALVLALLPVLNLAVARSTTEGERYLYWPSAFAVIAGVWLFGGRLRRSRELVVVLLLALACLAPLRHSARVWARAGELSRSVLASAGQLAARDSLCLLNLPDTLDGAYVFRNGFEEALLVAGHGQRLGPVNAVARHGVSDLASEVRARREGSLFILELDDPEAAFKPDSIAAISRRAGVTVLDHAPRRLELELVAPQYCAGPVYYSAGELHELLGNPVPVPVPFPD